MKSIVKTLEKINDIWMKIAASAMNCLLLLILVLFAITIIMRQIFGTNFFGQEEIVTTMAVWIYFIGAAFGTYEDIHVSGDLIKTLMKTRRARAIHRIYCFAINTAIAVVFTYLDIIWIPVCNIPKCFNYSIIRYSIGINSRSNSIL